MNKIEVKNSNDTIIYFDIDDTLADLSGYLNSLAMNDNIVNISNNIYNTYYKNSGQSFERVLRSAQYFKHFLTVHRESKILSNIIWNQISELQRNNKIKFQLKFLTLVPREKKIEKFLSVIRCIDSINNRFSDKYIINFVINTIKKNKEIWVKNILGKSNEIIFASLDRGGKEKFANNNAYLIDNDKNNVEKFTKAGGNGILFDKNEEYKLYLI